MGAVYRESVDSGLWSGVGYMRFDLSLGTVISSLMLDVGMMA